MALMRSTRAASPVLRAWISVWMCPGETAFTRMPSLANSFESPIVMASTAPFEAAYQTYSLGLPSVAAGAVLGLFLDSLEPFQSGKARRFCFRHSRERLCGMKDVLDS